MTRGPAWPQWQLLGNRRCLWVRTETSEVPQDKLAHLDHDVDDVRRRNFFHECFHWAFSSSLSRNGSNKHLASLFDTFLGQIGQLNISCHFSFSLNRNADEARRRQARKWKSSSFQVMTCKHFSTVLASHRAQKIFLRRINKICVENVPALRRKLVCRNKSRLILTRWTTF